MGDVWDAKRFARDSSSYKPKWYGGGMSLSAFMGSFVAQVPQEVTREHPAASTQEEVSQEELDKRGLMLPITVPTRRAAVVGESDKLEHFMASQPLGELLRDLGAGVGFKEVIEVEKDSLYSCFLQGGRWQAP